MIHWTCRLFAGVVCSFLWAIAAVGQESSVVDIGTKKQLFISDDFVESSTGVVFTMNAPHRTGQIILKADAPWEQAANGHIGSYCSLLKEEDTIRLWYDVRFGGSVQVAYAESTDGIHFTKPVLGLHELDGSKENNIVMASRIGGGAVWIDPKSPPGKRYRSQSKGYNAPTAERLYSYYSPDGIRWTQWNHLDVGDCDTQSIAFWDTRIERYVLYTRRNPFPRTPARSRIVRRLESDDLEHWENEITVMEADAVDNATYVSPTPKPPVDYYGAAVFRYPDPDGVYIMLSQPFWHYKRRPAEERWGKSGKENLRDGEYLGPSTIDVRLAVSTDGIDFQRVGDRKPFLGLGPEGSFDSRTVWAIPNPVRMGDELWFYYAANNTDHDGYTDPKASGPMSGIGLAKLRLDGFVSADADFSGGELTTRPLSFEGDRLEINVDTAGGGSLQIELLDEAGIPIPGYTRAEADRLHGNSVQMPVTWDGQQSVAKLAGKPVRLRFVMRDCKLYAFEFVDRR
jgi:hypothetical protein